MASHEGQQIDTLPVQAYGLDGAVIRKIAVDSDGKVKITGVDLSTYVQYSGVVTYSDYTIPAVSTSEGGAVIVNSEYPTTITLPAATASSYRYTIKNINTGLFSTHVLQAGFEGADGATTYTAETGQVATFAGTAQIDTSQYDIGASSLLLDGNSDYVTFPDNDSWTFGTNNFTIQCRVKLATEFGSFNYRSLFSIRQDANNSIYGYISSDNFGTRTLRFGAYIGSQTRFLYSLVYAFTTGSFYDITIQRVGTTIEFYINGVKQTITETTAIGSYSLPNLSAVLEVGADHTNSRYWDGWIDDFNIYNGLALRSGDFTPPSVAAGTSTLVTLDGNGSDTIDGNTTIPIVSMQGVQVIDYAAGKWAIAPLEDLSGYLKLDQTTPQTITASPVLNWLTASELISTDADKKLQSLAVATYPSLTELSYIKGLTSAIQTQLGDKVPYTGATTNVDLGTNDITALTHTGQFGAIGNDTTSNVTVYPIWSTETSGHSYLRVSSSKCYFNPATGYLITGNLSGSNTGDQDLSGYLTLNQETPQTITGSPVFETDGIRPYQIFASTETMGFQTLDTETYPSLTELSYIKGLTSAIQTQLGGKASLALDNLASVAINTSIFSDTDSTDDLGRSDRYWANGYIDKLYLNSTAYFDGTLVAGKTFYTGDLGINAPAGEMAHWFEVWSESGGKGGLAIRTLNNATSGSNVRLMKGRGTIADPRRAKSGDVLCGVNAFGYFAADDSTTATVTATASNAQFRFITAEDFTSTAKGTNFAILLAPVGSATNVEAFRISSEKVAKFAGTAVRGTTEGTNHIDIFDGTAPVGTLTNGVSLYSSSGELYAMDAAGNATLLSPHDKQGNWIYKSTDSNTGKTLQIDMEKMMKFLNKHFGTDFVKEFYQ